MATGETKEKDPQLELRLQGTLRDQIISILRDLPSSEVPSVVTSCNLLPLRSHSQPQTPTEWISYAEDELQEITSTTRLNAISKLLIEFEKYILPARIKNRKRKKPPQNSTSERDLEWSLQDRLRALQRELREVTRMLTRSLETIARKIDQEASCLDRSPHRQLF